MVVSPGEGTAGPVVGIIVVGGNPGGDYGGRYVAEALVKAGFSVDKPSNTGIDEKALESLLLKGIENPHMQILIVIGGIDHESGDVASRAAARVTGRRLVVSEEILIHMRSVFESRGRHMAHSDERLALIPRKAQVLKNAAGPFCGFMLEEGGKKLFFLPGSAEDMRPLLRESLFPLLADNIPSENLVCSRLFHVFGLEEGRIKELLAEAMPAMDEVEITYSETAIETRVNLSVSGLGGAEKLENLSDLIRQSIGDPLFAEDGGTMEETVGNLLLLKRASLATAESCTGGGIGDRLTDVPGSSGYFEMGVIAYSNESKTKLLGVQPSLIEKTGAVSSDVALHMAQGVRRLGRATFGLAVTGIAGPGGGSREKPVGTVFIALSSEEGEKFEKHLFEGSRADVKKMTSQAALDLLRRELMRR